MADSTKSGKSFRQSTAWKLTAVITLLLSMLLGLASFFASDVLYEDDYYSSSLEQLERNSLNDLCVLDINRTADAYFSLTKNGYFDEDISDTLKEALLTEFMVGRSGKDSDFLFTITNEQNEVILSSATDNLNDYQIILSSSFYDESCREWVQRMTQEEWDQYIAPSNVDVTYVEEIYSTDSPESILQYYDVHLMETDDTLSHRITGYVRNNLNEDSYYGFAYKKTALMYQFRYLPFVLLPICVILFFASLIFLISSAGCRKGQDTVTGSSFEKIPFDVFTAGLIVLCAGVVFLFSESDMVDTAIYLSAAAVCLCTLALLILWWLTSLSIRFRTGTLLSNNLIVLCARSAIYGIKRIGSMVGHTLIIWQALLIGIAFFVLQVFATLMLISGNTFGLILIILCYAAVVILLCIVFYNMLQLKVGAAKIAEGNLEHKIPEKALFGAFRQHAQHLNSISDGMNRAVTDRIRSEMFKTELIANVSHDIRTPLTSIINYTNLLSELELSDPQAQEYLEVLSRQSAKLRKLTEDVIEASKATTGNIKVQKERMDFQVLLEQIIGEYSEKFEARQLDLIVSLSQNPLFIMADGRLLWRVMDNLFANICKYAMNGTRVYLQAYSEERQVTLILRNISAVQLNMSADTLMERFVQGDHSRNTDGSGLGLSIAQSLTSLNGGSMDLQIDGDLFKVILQFPETE
jgi:signal transduction histidine kinase